MSARNATLPVSEVFGPTWQGEGRYAGRLCGFVRLGLCNLACSWCDTPYTWDHSRYDVKAECPPMAPDKLAAKVQGLDVPLVVLTGGEPLLHALPLAGCALGQLLYELVPGARVHVETNGTRVPPDWLLEYVEHFTVSPKLGNSGDPRAKRLVPQALSFWSGHAWAQQADFKFVVTRPEDLDDVDDVVNTYDVPVDRVWVMPEGQHSTDVMRCHRKLAEHILARRYNTTTRLQTLLYGNERGH